MYLFITCHIFICISQSQRVDLWFKSQNHWLGLIVDGKLLFFPIIFELELCKIITNVTICPSQPVPIITTSSISSRSFDRLVVPLISGQGHFTCLTTDITYITESGRKKNKQAETRVSLKRKKGEVCALFWHSMHLCQSRECTRTKFLHNYQERWFVLSRWLTWLLGPPVTSPRFNSRLFLTVSFPWLLLTLIYWLLWDIAFPHLLPVP